MAILNFDILGKVRILLRDILTVPIPVANELQLIADSSTNELHQIDSSGSIKPLVTSYAPTSGFEAVMFWDFTADTEGWAATNAVSTVVWDAGFGGSVIFSDVGASGVASMQSSATLFSVDGSKYTKVRVYATRLAGSTTSLRVSYQTAGHAITPASFSKTIPSPAQWPIGVSKELEYDMENLTLGGTDWITSTIQRIRVDFTNTVNIDDQFRVHWIAIGRNVPSVPANYQPIDADLTAISALTGTNTIYYRSADGVWTAVSIGANLTFTGGTLAATAGGGSGLTHGEVLARIALLE